MRVLIAGATSAVAQALMKRYSQQGAQFVCLARSEQKLRQQLQGNGLVARECIYLDFNHTETIPEAINRAAALLGGIDVALIAHGVLPDQCASEMDMKLLKQVFDDNCLSAIALVQAISCEMQQQGYGKLAVITSVAGDRGRPRNFSYGAAKSALNVYLQGLRSVLWGTGVEIYTLKLGPVDSPMTVDHPKNFSFTSPDNAAAVIEQALRKKRYEVYVPGFWRYVMLAVRVMPETIFQRLAFLSAR